MTTVEVTVKGDEQVRAQVGDTVELRLAESAGTGYRWTTGEVPDHVRLVSESFEAPADAGPGVGGHRVVRLLAASPGDQTVTLRLARGWEGSAAREHRVRLRVEPAAGQPAG